MLSNYLPDEYEDGDLYLRSTLSGHIDSQLHARPVPGNTHLSAYPRESPINKPALSARSITDTIDWHSLPDNHRLKPDTHGDGYTPDEWQLVREYSRIRGAAAHALHSTYDAEEAAKALRDELDALNDADDPDAMLDVVHRWDGSHRVTSPEDADVLGKTPVDALLEAAEDGAHICADNWDMASREHGMDALAVEPTIPEEVDGVTYCPCPDETVAIIDSDTLPDGVYTVDGKTGKSIKPAHIVQAEAQRRALDERLYDDVHGLILRLGPERGNWSILSSHDDDWLADEAWTLFLRKAEKLYDDTHVQAGLRRLEKDGR
ncbi:MULTISPECIES: hypothetical protein [Halorussus]|uniref:hypothetical protein n=1 Tax=Halorussus TaxID=1070314 RepID=UPI000E21615C|nr:MULTISPECIES: hypothetical protein [Halorussus]NHN60463.1 hypothetical protein [Halorussus sp. JP-T4]